MPLAAAITVSSMTWDLMQAYDTFPLVEEEFGAALDVSLKPRGPGQLYDIVSALGLPPGAVAVDVGCAEGGHTRELARRYGFQLSGVDPVERHLAAAREEMPNIPFLLGTAEDLPIADNSVDLVWCRDVLVHVHDVMGAYASFARVLKPGGYALIYQMYATQLLEPVERAFLERTMGVSPVGSDYADTASAIEASALDLLDRYDIDSEWGEYAQETAGKPGRNLLRAARLRRREEEYVARYGKENYDIMLGDCLWHVYAMIGKLTRRALVVRKPCHLPDESARP